jgi:AcrR family transcriptional regulator
MADTVKPLTRKERARRTRSRIIDAASALFATNGYGGTTMEAVARQSGVAVQTVYLVFRTKPNMLVETLMEVAWGPDPRSPAARRWLTDMEEAPDGPRRLAIAADAGVEIYRRAAPLFPALIAGSSVDDDVRATFARIVDERRAAMSHVISQMHDRGELREGITLGYGTEILIALHRHQLYLACIEECGWSVETFKAWLYRTLCQQLLPESIGTVAIAPGSLATAGTSFEDALRALP